MENAGANWEDKEVVVDSHGGTIVTSRMPRCNYCSTSAIRALTLRAPIFFCSDLPAFNRAVVAALHAYQKKKKDGGSS